MDRCLYISYIVLLDKRILVQIGSHCIFLLHNLNTHHEYAYQNPLRNRIVEDVLVQIVTFSYPVNFVVLDIEQSTRGINNVPIILGRPFLATSNAFINFRNGLMQLIFGNITVEVNVFNLIKKLDSYEEDPKEAFVLIVWGRSI